MPRKSLGATSRRVMWYGKGGDQVCAAPLMFRERFCRPPAALAGRSDPDNPALRGGIVVSAKQMNGFIRFVAEDPAVMTTWNGKCVPGREDEFGSIGHTYGRSAGHHHTDMIEFTERGARRGPDIPRPPPAGFVTGPPDRLTRDATELETTAWELADLAAVEVLDLELHWASSLSFRDPAQCAPGLPRRPCSAACDRPRSMSGFAGRSQASPGAGRDCQRRRPHRGSGHGRARVIR